MSCAPGLEDWVVRGRLPITLRPGNADPALATLLQLCSCRLSYTNRAVSQASEAKTQTPWLGGYRLELSV